MPQHTAQTTHTFQSDDDRIAIVLVLEAGEMKELYLTLKGSGAGPIDATPAEIVELAAVTGQAAGFLAELGFQEDPDDE